MRLEFLSNLRLRILGNWEISGKFQNFIDLPSAIQSSSQDENFVNTGKNLLKKNLKFLKTKKKQKNSSFTLKLEFVSNILWLIVVMGEEAALIQKNYNIPSFLICSFLHIPILSSSGYNFFMGKLAHETSFCNFQKLSYW